MILCMVLRPTVKVEPMTELQSSILAAKDEHDVIFETRFPALDFTGL
jgi:hypothetical protein